MRFEGQVGVITGAGSGIGRATARRLAAEGATVAVLDIDHDAAHRTAEAIITSGGAASAHQVDIAVTDAVTRVVSEVLDRWGRIDVLVNNAAVAVADDLQVISDQDWDREIDVALGGTFRMIRAVLAPMTATGGGAIVNLGSVNGRGMFGQEAYSAAKAGIESITRTVAVRHGRDGIRVNTVVPGTVRTEAWDARIAADPQVLERTAQHYPLGRVGQPEDIAAAIAFLASSEASWITGTSLVIDGGLTVGGFGLFEMVARPRAADGDPA